MAAVIRTSEGHRLAEDERLGGLGNRFLAHLSIRQFSMATVRAYAYDLANFTRFLTDRGLDLVAVVPTDMFDYLDWQQSSARPPAATVVPCGRVAGRRL